MKPNPAVLHPPRTGQPPRTGHPSRIVRSRLVALSLLLPLLLGTVLVLFPVAAEAAQPNHYGRDYPTGERSRAALNELLWNACPQDGEATCLVADPETENGAARLVAPPAVHRAVARLLSGTPAARITRTVRVDLVQVQPGGGVRMPPSLPASLQRALGTYGAAHGNPSLAHLGTTEIATDRSATTYLVTGAGTFEVEVGLSEDSLSDDGAVRLRHLGLDTRGGEGDGFKGRILQTSLAVPPGQTLLAGTTHTSPTTPPLLVFVTVER